MLSCNLCHVVYFKNWLLLTLEKEHLSCVGQTNSYKIIHDHTEPYKTNKDYAGSCKIMQGQKDNTWPNMTVKDQILDIPEQTLPYQTVQDKTGRYRTTQHHTWTFWTIHDHKRQIKTIQEHRESWLQKTKRPYRTPHDHNHTRQDCRNPKHRPVQNHKETNQTI